MIPLVLQNSVINESFIGPVIEIPSKIPAFGGLSSRDPIFE
jgi:hypothetical protein